MNKKEELKKKYEEKIKRDFGLHLKKLRENKGLSLRELAALANLDHSGIGKSENGVKNTPVQDLYALAEALGVDICELISYKKA